MATKKKETVEEPVAQNQQYRIIELPHPGRLHIRSGADSKPTGPFLFENDVVETVEADAPEGFASLADGRGWFSLEYAEKV